MRKKLRINSQLALADFIPVFYANGWWWLGLPCSFYFFLTGLRQSHNAQHYSMGLPRVFQDLVLISYSMFFHAEHHLFPAVPTCHLAVLAKRLDAVTLKFAGQQVIEIKLKAPTQTLITN
jgi:hypothetical protein